MISCYYGIELAGHEVDWKATWILMMSAKGEPAVGNPVKNDGELMAFA